MAGKELVAVLIQVLLLSGCAMASRQDQDIKNDSSSVRVSGDATVSAVDGKGF